MAITTRCASALTDILRAMWADRDISKNDKDRATKPIAIEAAALTCAFKEMPGDCGMKDEVHWPERFTRKENILLPCYSRDHEKYDADFTHWFQPRFCSIRNCRLGLDLPIGCQFDFRIIGIRGYHLEKGIEVQVRDVLRLLRGRYGSLPNAKSTPPTCQASCHQIERGPCGCATAFSFIVLHTACVLQPHLFLL